MSIFLQLERSKSLPPGHVDRKRAESAVKKEYDLCREVEKKWVRRVKHSFNNADDVLAFCNKICRTLGEAVVLKVVANSSDVKPYSAAHYVNREIHFASNFFPLTTVVHELTHHFGQRGHDKAFCDLENFLFSVVYTELTGKQPKADW